MPVLDREPTIWPESLFEGAADARVAQRWCAYHVRPRTEKSSARYLRGNGGSYFLPQQERQKRYQRRLVRSYVPLFPGYVFVLTTDDEDERIPNWKDVLQRIPIEDQPRVERELRDLHWLIQSGRPVTREQRLQPGQMARIVNGPLAGLCGEVIANKRGLKFVLRVQFLQQGVSIEVDDGMIEAI